MAGLWVGGLPWYVTEGSLHEWCGWHGVYPTWVQILRGRADATKCSCVLHFHDAGHRDYSRRLLPYYYDGCRISVREQDAAKAKSAGVPKAAPSKAAPAKAIPPWRMPAAKAAAVAAPAREVPPEAAVPPPEVPAEAAVPPPEDPAQPVHPPEAAVLELPVPAQPESAAFDDWPEEAWKQEDDTKLDEGDTKEEEGELKEEMVDEACDVPSDQPREESDLEEAAEISPTVLAESPGGSSSGTEMATIHDGPSYETEAWMEHSTFRNHCFLFVFVNFEP